MVDKEAKVPPALIDYESSTNMEVERWTATNVEKFWGQCLVRKRKLSAQPWSLKTKTLAKKLIEEFELEDLKSMIHYWVESANIGLAARFEVFYTRRYDLYDKIKPKDYSEWEV